MVAIAAHKQSEEVKKQLAEGIRPHIDIFRTAALGYLDDVIDRARPGRCSPTTSGSARKEVERPGASARSRLYSRGRRRRLSDYA